MAHILVCGVSAPSHTLPHVALVAELVARGHRVTYSTGEPLRELAETTGADVVCHPSLLPVEGAADGGWPDDPVDGMRLFLEEAIAVLPRLTAAFDQDRPDLVAFDSGAHQGRVLAHRWDVPGMVLSPTTVAWEGYEEDLAETLEPIRASAGWAGYDAAFTAWFAEHGMPRGWEETVAFPDHGIVMVPRAMQPREERVDPAMHFAGPTFDEAQLAQTWQPTRRGRLLYVASGSAATDRAWLYRAAAEAAEIVGDWHVVIATGHTDPATLADLPGSVELHRWLPQLAVLATADAFITHAGMDSCSEAMWQGVPMIAVPAAVDQFANAEQLETVGAGLHVPGREPSAKRLAAALRAVMEPAVQAAVAELRREIRAAGGARWAAQAVEAALWEG